jgi:hypothetical protein
VLIAKYGRDEKRFTWTDELTADCPRKRAGDVNDQCAVSGFATRARLASRYPYGRGGDRGLADILGRGPFKGFPVTCCKKGTPKLGFGCYLARGYKGKTGGSA